MSNRASLSVEYTGNDYREVDRELKIVALKVANIWLTYVCKMHYKFPGIISLVYIRSALGILHMLARFITITLYEAGITTTIFAYLKIIIIVPTLQIRKWTVGELNYLPQVS